MSLDASALRKLASLALNPEQMAGVLDVLASMTEQEEARKAAQRERTRKFREKIGVTLQSHHGNGDKSRASVTRVEDKTLTLEIEPLKEEKKETRDALFDRFWDAFPNKVGKPKAKAAFPTAMRRAKSIDAIMGGLERYIANKPPDRAYLNPATFLNQERWADQPAVVVPMSRGSPAGKVTPYDVGRRLLDEMETANARTTAEIGGHQSAPRLLSSG